MKFYKKLTPIYILISISAILLVFDASAAALLPDTPGFEDVTINDIEVISRSNVWIVGDGGKVAHWDGADWIPHTGTWGTATIYDVSASSSTNVWIAGGSGAVYRYDGTTWGSHEPVGTRWDNSTIRGVSALSTNKAWIAGNSGHVWKYDGSSWFRESDTNRWGAIQLESVSVLSATEVWIAGANGHVWECQEAATWGTDTCNKADGSDGWDQHSGTGRWETATVNAVSAYASDEVWLGANTGNVWRYNGSIWSQFSGTGRWSTSNINDVSNRYSTEQWVVGPGGRVFEYNLPRWEIAEIVSGTDDDVTINGITYNRNFYMENVCRSSSDPRGITGITDTNGTTETCVTSGGIHDPSTLKVTVSVSWTGGETITRSEYITRWNNYVCVQTQWSTAATTSVQFCPSIKYDTAVNVSTGSSLTITTIGVTPGDFTSTVFDTTILGTDDRGPIYNSVTWIGSADSSDRVRFKLATSDCSNGATNPPTCNTGSWTYLGDNNGDGSCSSGDSDWYEWVGNVSNTVKEIKCYSDHSTKRYFRYKLNLCSNDNNSDSAACVILIQGDNSGPIVNDVFINWSP